jgi:hypothetical protein
MIFPEIMILFSALKTMIAYERYFNMTDAHELWFESIETSPTPMIYLFFNLCKILVLWTNLFLII